MGGKGAATKQRIVEQAAAVFNQRGYWGSSLSDLMAATGLEKGGIYNHFGSKDALAAAAFDHNTAAMGDLIRSRLAGVDHAIDRLHALVDTFDTFVADPPFPGGCPILNTAIEADDTHPDLLARARATMDDLLDGTFARVIRRGVERGELAADTDPTSTATFLVSALEGAIALSRLYGDPAPMRRTAAHLHRFVDTLRREQ